MTPFMQQPGESDVEWLARLVKAGRGQLSGEERFSQSNYEQVAWSRADGGRREAESRGQAQAESRHQEGLQEVERRGEKEQDEERRRAAQGSAGETQLFISGRARGSTMREQPDLGQRDGETPEAWLARLQGVDAAALTMHQRIARSHGKDRAERLIKERRAPPPAAGGTESPPAVPPPPGPGVAAPPALGLAKDAYLRLSAGDRRQFNLWLAGQ